MPSWSSAFPGKGPGRGSIRNHKHRHGHRHLTRASAPPLRPYVRRQLTRGLHRAPASPNRSHVCWELPRWLNGVATTLVRCHRHRHPDRGRIRTRVFRNHRTGCQQQKHHNHQTNGPHLFHQCTSLTISRCVQTELCPNTRSCSKTKQGGCQRKPRWDSHAWSPAVLRRGHNQMPRREECVKL